MRGRLLLAWLCVSLPPSLLRGAEPPVDFQRDVRPILADKCFACHGPDAAARQAELRLDDREAALERGALRPGRATDSLLVQRIRATSAERMPPPDSGRVLTAQQIRILERWMDEGAGYARHWSFVPPVAPPLPEVRNADWVRNPIDRFVLAALERHDRQPSPAADPGTWLRRVSLVLNGLPPTPADVDAFVADPSDAACEQVLERLLHSPRYAERMTVDWLDAGRYADTHGHFSDFPRATWPWRDWVLRAFAQNMPFDQFTIEQLAGDRLPAATHEQKLATAFLRNHMMTDETGIIDEEYRLGYVADRLETVATVWLGLTLGCAKCHDHKYDPVSQREYYQLFACFNNVPETGLIYGQVPPAPVLPLPAAELEQQLATLQNTRAAIERDLQTLEPALQQAEANWLAEDTTAAPVADLALHLDFEQSVVDRSPHPHTLRTTGEVALSPAFRGTGGGFDTTQYLEFEGPPLETDAPFTIAVWFKPGSAPVHYLVTKLDDTPAQRGLELFWYKSQPRLQLVRTWRREAIEVAATDIFSGGEWHHILVSYDGSGQAGGVTFQIDGKPQRLAVRRDNLEGAIANPAPWRIGWKGSGLGLDGQLDEFRLYRRALTPAEAQDLYRHDVLAAARQTAVADRPPHLAKLVRKLYLQQAPPSPAREALNALEQLQQQTAALQRQIPSVAIMQELPEPRATHILTRGQYDQPGDKVTPALPRALLTTSGNTSSTAAATITDRLGLANWLVSPNNPLTARVTVNRLWQQVFGEGLVRTVNDFGLQGEPPTHPELLDWLAVEFIRSGWNVQRMLRLMLTSATFRQSSSLTPELRETDPDNRSLARGPRFRLPGEVLRDQALLAGGLLVEQLGGPSVKPYQPPGLWEAVSYNGDQSYQQDHGPGLYRRSLYTFWKRQSPPPDLLVLDGPTREACSVRRSRTNTPLQALLLLNDITYVEAARGLAGRMLRDGGETVRSRIAYGFQLTTGRRPTEPEITALEQLYQRQHNVYLVRPGAARELLAVGELPLDSRFSDIELATWTVVGTLLLNLDEALTLH